MARACECPFFPPRVASFGMVASPRSTASLSFLFLVYALRRARQVKVGTRVFDRFGNLSEIDVIGEKRGWLARFWPSIFRRRAAKVVPWGASSLWVECKNYRAGNTVTLDDVAKFKSVLDLNNVPHARGFVCLPSPAHHQPFSPALLCRSATAVSFRSPHK